MYRTRLRAELASVALLGLLPFWARSGHLLPRLIVLATWGCVVQVAENARLSGQLEDGLREQQKYLGILQDIVNATPDVQDNVCEIFGALILGDRLRIVLLHQHTCISPERVSLRYTSLWSSSSSHSYRSAKGSPDAAAAALIT